MNLRLLLGLTLCMLLPIKSEAEEPDPWGLPSVRSLLQKSLEQPNRLPGPADLEEDPALAGEIPWEAYPNLKESVHNIWNFIKSLGGAPKNLRPPVIYFAPFNPKKQAPAWTQWQREWSSRHPEIYLEWLCNYSGRAKYPQVSDDLCGHPDQLRAWFSRHPEVRREYPFPETFRAFHYDGTNRIQINPHTTYVGIILQAVSLEQTGLGYYVTGHEMLHYVLDQKGVPGKIHHCLFIMPQPGGRKSYMEQLVDFLSQKGYASSFTLRFFGMNPEIELDPCGSRSHTGKK